jgi:hypothetical protein
MLRQNRDHKLERDRDLLRALGAQVDEERT